MGKKGGGEEGVEFCCIGYGIWARVPWLTWYFPVVAEASTVLENLCMWAATRSCLKRRDSIVSLPPFRPCRLRLLLCLSFLFRLAWVCPRHTTQSFGLPVVAGGRVSICVRVICLGEWAGSRRHREGQPFVKVSCLVFFSPVGLAFLAVVLYLCCCLSATPAPQATYTTQHAE